MNSFGARFGALIKRRRGIEGLTQQQLSVRAFGDETHKPRISELENGRVANPQQRIIDALSVALNVSDDEVATCRRAAVPALPKDFVKRIGLTEELVDALAWQFSNAHPRADLFEYQKFLHSKSDEIFELQARIADLGKANRNIAARMAHAKIKVRQGLFDEADQILCEAETIQRNQNTLQQIEKYASIRAARARVELVRGNAEAAFARLQEASEFFEPFDRLMAVEQRGAYCDLLYASGEKFGEEALSKAFELAAVNLERSLGLPMQVTARIQVQCGRIECLRGFVGTDLAHLDAAISYHQAALGVFTRRSYPLEWATVRCELGKTFRIRGERNGQPAQLKLALKTLAPVMTNGVFATFPTLWAQAQHNAGFVLWRLGEFDGAPATIRKGIRSFEHALKIHDKRDHPKQWAETQNGLGLASWTLGHIIGDGETLRKSASAFQAALEVQTVEREPLIRAGTSSNLGLVLTEIGAGSKEPDAIVEAIASFKEALRIYNRRQSREHWLSVRHNLANALSELGILSGLRKPLLQARNIFLQNATLRSASENGLRLAYTYHCLGETLFRLGLVSGEAGWNERAIETLSVALGLYEKLGESNWSNEARKLLSKAGERAAHPKGQRRRGRRREIIRDCA